MLFENRPRIDFWNIKIKFFKDIFSNKQSFKIKDEKMRDTLIDLHNYAAMAIMLLDEQKEW